ncbi:MAG: nucleotidyl transferase AbiEii/AbiGii toxin family protein, partial [Ignavibacteriaceae bacterium]|nr:nucleotidyl transferase AbiEii/AbiGii toxin family protein [Ignavibacteriaceae bacterium]
MMNFGGDNLKYDVLVRRRIQLLERLKQFIKDFYLAGGTALALQMGHRISVDFDFFSSIGFDNGVLLNKIRRLFLNEDFSVLQNEKNTLTVMVGNEVKLSFFSLEYQNLFPLMDSEFFRLASVHEIGIMKLIALARASYKDYVDIYFILKQIPLSQLLASAEKKHPEFDKAIYIRALLSYDDVDDFP